MKPSVVDLTFQLSIDFNFCRKGLDKNVEVGHFSTSLLPNSSALVGFLLTPRRERRTGNGLSFLIRPSIGINREYFFASKSFVESWITANTSVSRNNSRSHHQRVHYQISP